MTTYARDVDKNISYAIMGMNSNSVQYAFIIDMKVDIFKEDDMIYYNY